jgi:hypothetical protein
MEPKLHAILGHIHSLLSVARPEDFERASRLRGVSPFMREVLRALARERNYGSRKDGEDGGLPRKTQRERKVTPWPGEHARVPVARGKEDQVLALILQSSRLSKKADVENFARAMGLVINVRRKDAWRRAIRKLATAIAMAPDEVRKRSMDALMASRDSQTQGWVNVIRKSR